MFIQFGIHTESWNCAIVLVVGRNLWKLSTELRLLRAGPAKAACSGLCPFGFWQSPNMETPQQLLATPSSVCSPFQYTVGFFSLHLNKIYCISVCIHCFLSCHMIPLRVLQWGTAKWESVVSVINNISELAPELEILLMTDLTDSHLAVPHFSLSFSSSSTWFSNNISELEILLWSAIYMEHG